MNSAEGTTMTAKQKVLAIYPDAFAMRCWIGCWHIKRDQNDNHGLSKLENSVTIESEEAAWQNAAESLPSFFTDADDDAHMDGHARMVHGAEAESLPIEGKDKPEPLYAKAFLCAHGLIGCRICHRHAEPVTVAEPKPTPSTEDEPCEWYGRNVGPHDWIDTPDGWKRCANCKRELKPQPSSISTEPGFDAWWWSFVTLDDMPDTTQEIAQAAWAAAKVEGETHE